MLAPTENVGPSPSRATKMLTLPTPGSAYSRNGCVREYVGRPVLLVPNGGIVRPCVTVLPSGCRVLILAIASVFPDESVPRMVTSSMTNRFPAGTLNVTVSFGPGKAGTSTTSLANGWNAGLSAPLVVTWFCTFTGTGLAAVFSTITPWLFCLPCNVCDPHRITNKTRLPAMLLLILDFILSFLLMVSLNNRCSSVRASVTTLTRPPPRSLQVVWDAFEPMLFLLQ
jgi:hypothetical protein